MSEYHSNVLRDLATWLKERPNDVVSINTMWARIVCDAADRIDDLQRQVGVGLEQTARLADEVQKLK